MESKDASQSEGFLEGEGDAWFSRNYEQLESIEARTFEIDFICDSLAPFRNKVQNILEIGCASGKKVAQLAEYFEASGFGLDPSQMAINRATELTMHNNSNLNFEVGLATNLPYPDGMFDLVFFGFCLYLVPPSETYKALMEANRVLKQGGFVAILDFDYGSLKVNPYKHADGLFTYENNYSQILTSSGYFSLVSKWSYNHTSNYFIQERDERIAIEILYKELL